MELRRRRDVVPFVAALFVFAAAGHLLAATRAGRDAGLDAAFTLLRLAAVLVAYRSGRTG